MASSIHSVARDLLVSAFADTAVAAAAVVHPTAWVGRILTGDRDGYVGELHRGRLPAVEIIQEPGESWKQAALDRGSVTASWRIRVHVGGISQSNAEKVARDILYAGLIKVRAQNYFKIGDEVVNGFTSSPLGFFLDAVLSVVTAMTRETYETEPNNATVPATSGGDVGGILVTINYTDSSPVTILMLPANAAIDTVSVEVVTAFDGVTPTLTIGVDGEQERYMAAIDDDLTAANSVFERDADDAGPRTVKVWLDPGAGATQGQVKVQISVTNA